MKTFLVTLLLVSALAVSAAARQTDKPAKHDAHKDHKADAAGEVVKRGTPIGDKSPAVKFADVFKEPQKFAGKPVVIEGVVERVCKAEGCWMQIAPEAGAAETVRVTFDHKFSVPKDADKMKFRAEGEFSVKVLSKETRRASGEGRRREDQDQPRRHGQRSQLPRHRRRTLEVMNAE